MREIKSPYFVLKAEFEALGKLDYGGLIDYITREEIKENAQTTLAKDSSYKFDNSKLKIKEEQYLRYLDYINRKAVLEKKDKLTPEELANLNYIDRRNNDFSELLKGMKKSTFQTNLKTDLQTGMFDFYSDDLSMDDVKEYKQKFSEAQHNNSVMYKDVLSFSTEALIAAGIYNPYTDELNRKPLIDASRKMLREMYRREGLEATGISVCEVHYNTNHFHIHFATVESKNTRKLIEFEGVIQARGMRKESTLQSMKSVFANHIFDSSDELAQISELRNKMRQGVKDELEQTESRKALALESRLRNLLPPDKRQWNSKNLSEPARQIMRDLIDELMSSNSEFNRYKRLALQEDEHKQQMFGKLSDHQTSFYEGRMHGQPDGVYYRLGNSILQELRKSDSESKKSKEILKKVTIGHNKMKLNPLRFISSSEYHLRRLEYAADRSFENYKIEIERNKLERDIDRARYEQSLS